MREKPRDKGRLLHIQIDIASALIRLKRRM